MNFFSTLTFAQYKLIDIIIILLLDRRRQRALPASKCELGFGKMLLRFRRSAPIYRVVLKTLLGSFSTEDGDVSENVTLKRNSRFFQTFPRLFQFAWNVKSGWIFLDLISWVPHWISKRERKIRRGLFVSSVKREIMHFHVIVVQRQQRNVQEKCDARANLLFCLQSNQVKRSRH